jgi:hypothetical protein
MFEQQKPDHKLGVLGRTSDIGKRLPVFVFKILPRDELRDAKPAVPLVELAAEGKKLWKKRPSGAVFRSVHGLKLLRKVHGFRGINSSFRALEALNLPVI